jgi:hypothetical protein
MHSSLPNRKLTAAIILGWILFVFAYCAVPLWLIVAIPFLLITFYPNLFVHGAPNWTVMLLFEFAPAILFVLLGWLGRRLVLRDRQ